MKENVVQCVSVYGLSVDKMKNALQKVKGLKYDEPFVNKNNFCCVLVMNMTKKQCLELYRLL